MEVQYIVTLTMYTHICLCVQCNITIQVLPKINGSTFNDHRIMTFYLQIRQIYGDLQQFKKFLIPIFPVAE